MANFSLSSCYTNIAKLLIAISKYPLELQLIWLTDILCNTMLIKYPKTFVRFVSKDNTDEINVSYRFLIKILGAEFKSQYLIELLFSFRNAYVHKGADIAKQYFDKLMCEKEALSELTEYAGATLNFNRIMYDLIK